MRKIDYSFLKYQIPGQIVSISNVISDLKSNQLILAYIGARQDSDIPILLVIPCLVLDFLCIHPFADGI